jgi:hypothetical protein
VGDGKYKSIGRIRWHVSPEPFHPGSHAEWNESIDVRRSDTEAIEFMRRLVKKVCATQPIVGHWELLKGARSVKEFVEALEAMPGVNKRSEPLDGDTDPA